MTFDLSPHTVPAIAMMAGLILGLAHFTSLRTVTAMLLAGRHPARALALQLARMAVIVAAFAGFAVAGALPLLGGTTGLLIGRTIVLRRVRRETECATR